MDAKSNQQIVVAFKASPDVVTRIDAVARTEGTTRAAVARRLVLKELNESKQGDAA